MPKRVAVFVDGENVGPDHAKAITRIADSHGTVDVKRVYGNLNLIPGWMEMPGYRFIHSGSGKNSTDMLLVIQAIELSVSEQFGTVVIASSDRDFTHLATRLRERGIDVIGAGNPHANPIFRAACSDFVELAQARATAIAGNLITELDRKIRKVIAANSKNGHGMRLADLNPAMRNQHQTMISKLPEKTWRNYFASRPVLYQLDAKGPDAKVRFRPDGFS